MTRRLCAWTAAMTAALSLWAAVPAAAESTVGPLSATPAPVEDRDDQAGGKDDPTTPVPTTPAPTTPPGAGGGIDAGGEVTLPNPDAPAPGSPRVLVFGDSISAVFRYSPNGAQGRPKAWWAYVADAAGVRPKEVMLSAEGGSGLLMRGMVRTGAFCSGTTFGDRLREIGRTRPDVILVEVGRNDIKHCTGTSRRASTLAERRAAAVEYFGALAAQADRHGIPRSSVYVLTAWGAAYSGPQVATTTIYEAEATARGLTWVPVPALTRQQTKDGTHPTAQGARAIGNAVLRSSDVVTAIRSRGARHAAVPAGARVVCTGVRPCKAKKQGANAPAATSYRTWGTKPGTATHHVAERVTRTARVVPVLGASTARQWRLAARREGAAKAVAHARVGDVAWWNDAPAGVGSGTGHVAVVEKVSPRNDWVVVSEVTAHGTFRTARYTGRSLPRAYLRFTRTQGGPRGLVGTVRGTRNTLVVKGRVVDTDAVRRPVAVKVTVKQGARTWTRVLTRRAKPGFAQRLTLPGLRKGPAVVHVTGLNVPGTRGADRKLDVRTIVVG